MADATVRDAYDRQHIRIIVEEVLESQFRLEYTEILVLLDMYFDESFLPDWYFYANTPGDIAAHVFIITQMLNASLDLVKQENEERTTITYFLNVGRDFPGRLLRILRENVAMSVTAFDSVKTCSGIRILTIERNRAASKKHEQLWEDAFEGAAELLDTVKVFASMNGYKHAESFLRSLTDDYIREEILSSGTAGRLKRHLDVYEKTLSQPPVQVLVEGIDLEELEQKSVLGIWRVTVGLVDGSLKEILKVLKLVEDQNINLIRSYYDLFTASQEGGHDVAILSLYVDAALPMDFREKIIKTAKRFSSFSSHENPADSPSALVGKENLDVLNLVRKISNGTDVTHYPEERSAALKALRDLVTENSDITIADEKGSFLLNSLSDFFEAAEYLGIADNEEIMMFLLGFESFTDFFVECRIGSSQFNQPGYRVRHSSLRGTSKGGLRIDPIVDPPEVAGLAFMMTWKCARSRVLFGGGKGGILLDPKKFSTPVDWFDSLSSFGRSLFLITGPFKDVPAGDVGCGAKEIGHLFEGFKSALRDLALLATGIKKGVAFIGNQVVSVESARSILYDHFDLDYRTHRELLKQLVTNEQYLEKVVSAQITGKPSGGIQARTGATGRGISYAVVAAVVNMYFDGQWEANEKLTSRDEEQLLKIRAVDGDSILAAAGREIIHSDDWRHLCDSILPKLLRGKKLIVQGAGKVGLSVIENLTRFGMDLKAVGDAGGAIVGESLQLSALRKAIEESSKHNDRAKRSSVIWCKDGVESFIEGASEGSSILTLSCDVLVPAALENAITMKNAGEIKAHLLACGSNGPISTKAAKILQKKGIPVIYDFLANSAGVIASYFEWLRNLSDRYRYEAEKIHRTHFDALVLSDFIMPEFRSRILGVLERPESMETTLEWNHLLRDILFAAVNEDYRLAKDIRMKTAGFTDAVLRVLAAAKATGQLENWDGVSHETMEQLEKYLRHPEILLFRGP